MIWPETFSLGAVRASLNASHTSKIWINGLHGVPSLSIFTSPVVQARPAKLLTARSKRIRGDGPYTVAFRNITGVNVSLALESKYCSFKTFDFAYAVSG